MSYTFAEKKRIRKSFAKRTSVLPVPYLLTTQLQSFFEFLQADTDPNARTDSGLQAAFTSIIPIVSHSGNAPWTSSVTPWASRYSTSSSASIVA